MPLSYDQLKQLISKYLAGKSSAAEKSFLEKLYAHFEQDPDFLLTLSAQEKEELQAAILKETWKKTDTKAVIIPLFRRAWLRAAVIIFLLLAAGTYLFILQNQGPDKAPLANIPATQHDIDPGGDKAILTLADGSQIILDQAANGDLALEGGTRIIKKGGELDYSSGAETEVLYNTIATPRGGQFHLVLADGTGIWLNAASTLRYPTSFPGKERIVELTGEGYFEVAPHAKQPFKVRIAGQSTVEALGTHFNINAYPEESTVNTTLLEGKVRVSSDKHAGNSLVLAPGQQSREDGEGRLSLNREPDLEEVMAWKNGRFVFGESMDIQSAMRQIARWYDVDVVFEGHVPGHIGGSIPRNVTVSQVFKMLEKTGAVKIRLEGKKVTVMAQPKK